MTLNFYGFLLVLTAFFGAHCAASDEISQPPFSIPNKEMAHTPITVPNGRLLEWTMEDGVKVFHLIAEPVKREFAPGLIVNCWGYNGQVPGPVIEAVEGDRVRIKVTNKLDAPTTVHWHGVLLPNGMDGVSGLNQKPIQPGETGTYEFTLKQHGTCMYHPHYDEMTQIAMGMNGFFIIHPKEETEDTKVDRDFVIFLNEWAIQPGTYTPDPNVMLDFNYFTFNGCVYPKTESLVVREGQKVRIRLGNLSMDNHPIHLHGHTFTITGTGGCTVPKSAQHQDVTVDVPVGSTRDIEFVADVEGDWAFHCHKTHHVMSGMVHGLPNMIGVNQSGVEEKIQKLIPGYMAMGEKGMGDMTDMGGPPNYLPMSSPGPYGKIEMNGMFTILKVRKGITSYTDPGWYTQPPGTSVKISP